MPLPVMPLFLDAGVVSVALAAGLIKGADAYRKKCGGASD